MVIKNEEVLRQFAPAALTQYPDPNSVSSKYQFLPTTEVLEVLQDEGWEVWNAVQVRSRKSSPLHCKHMIRLRHQDLDAESLGYNDSFPELLVINAHNGLSSYNLRAGIFRMVCSNGMVVADTEFDSVRIRHQNFDYNQVMDYSRNLVRNAEKISSTVTEWQGIELSEEKQLSFALDASKLRWKDGVDEDTARYEVLRARRHHDRGDSLWLTYQRTQENLMRGGYMPSMNSRRRSGEVRNIDANVNINTGLWDLATAYAAN